MAKKPVTNMPNMHTVVSANSVLTIDENSPMMIFSRKMEAFMKHYQFGDETINELIRKNLGIEFTEREQLIISLFKKEFANRANMFMKNYNDSQVVELYSLTAEEIVKSKKILEHWNTFKKGMEESPTALEMWQDCLTVLKLSSP